jgi:hypothetical protein
MCWYNYITNTWTTASRPVRDLFVNTYNDKLYISRADADSMSEERKNGNYTDFVDEGTDVTIVSVSDDVVFLDSVTGIEAGDVLVQESEDTFAVIQSVDLMDNSVTLLAAFPFVAGSAEVQKAIEVTVQWKPQVGDNPAYVRQIGEGTLIFRRTGFSTARMDFATDVSQSFESVTITGTGSVTAWGLFPWGTVPWGGISRPKQPRYYVPAEKQIGSMIIPRFVIKQGYSSFQLEGLSLLYNPVSPEVFK